MRPTLGIHRDVNVGSEGGTATRPTLPPRAAADRPLEAGSRASSPCGSGEPSMPAKRSHSHRS